jgi:hypothetical protein
VSEKDSRKEGRMKGKVLQIIPVSGYEAVYERAVRKTDTNEEYPCIATEPIFMFALVERMFEGGEMYRDIVPVGLLDKEQGSICLCDDAENYSGIRLSKTL